MTSDLDGNSRLVNDEPLSPVSFLLRSVDVWGDRPAITYGERSWTYADHFDRVGRAKNALVNELGIHRGDRVAFALPNVPAALELHYAVPAADAVLVPMNTRLSASEYGYILQHSDSRVLVAHRDLRDPIEAATRARRAEAPAVIWVGNGASDDEWDAMVDAHSPSVLHRPQSENALLSLNYTSGTTGPPKGVMATHRGAYLHSLGVIAESRLTTSSQYLWTLPMFHCNGWAYTWAVTAAGAEHVCLERVDPERIWGRLNAGGATHMCAAPTVVTRLLQSPDAKRLSTPATVFVGGSPPSPTLLAAAADLNISIVHLYGLTETYGPISVCAWNPDWDELAASEQARFRARQGVATIVSERLRVVDDAMHDVPADGNSIGEVVMRGNNVMAGYYRDPDATEAAFRGGWFHSGDLAVMHPDRRVEIRDRLKDVIISGGENIASVEIEQALCSFADVAEAAVVGTADAKWGEVPVAYVVLLDGRTVAEDDLRRYLRERMAHYKVPHRIVVVPELPKTATGKVVKFQLREWAATASERGVRQ